MTDTMKQAYLETTTDQLRQWSARANVMKARIAQGTAGAQTNFHEHVRNWHEKETVFKLRIEELGTASADRYEMAKAGVQHVYKQMGTLLANLEGNKQ